MAELGRVRMFCNSSQSASRWWGLVVLLVSTAGNSSQNITLTAQPESQQVCVGGRAEFPCRFSGTTGVPYWFINDGVCTIRSLPNERYRYSGWALIIDPVIPSDDGTRVKCGLHVISSTEATLSVVTYTFNTHRIYYSGNESSSEDFPVDLSDLSELRHSPGKLLPLNIKDFCGHSYKQVILINTETDTSFLTENSENILTLLDPSSGPIFLNNTVRRQSPGLLTWLGLPASASSLNGTDDGWDPDTGRVILNISPDLDFPVFLCGSSETRCHFENISFELSEEDERGSGVTLIDQNLGEVVIENCGMEGAAVFVNQHAGTLSISNSHFLVSSDSPAIKGDGEVMVRNSDFECFGACIHAIDLEPYTPDCRWVRLVGLEVSDFPQAISIRSNHDGAGSRRVPIIIKELLIITDDMNATAITLSANLRVDFKKNNISGYGQVLNLPGYLPQPGTVEKIRADMAAGKANWFNLIPRTEEPDDNTPIVSQRELFGPTEEQQMQEGRSSASRVIPLGIWSFYFVWKILN